MPSFEAIGSSWYSHKKRESMIDSIIWTSKNTAKENTIKSSYKIE